MTFNEEDISRGADLARQLASHRQEANKTSVRRVVQYDPLGSVYFSPRQAVRYQDLEENGSWSCHWRCIELGPCDISQHSENMFPGPAFDA